MREFPITFTIALIDEDGEMEELNELEIHYPQDVPKLTHPLQAREFAEWIQDGIKTWLEDNDIEVPSI